MQSLGYTSAPPLLKYLRYAEQLGVAIEPALATVGLQAQQLSDNSLRLPGEAHERLLDYLCEQTGDPLFGLNSARFVLPNSWNVLGYITMNCATLGDAMNRIIPFEKLVGDMGTSRAVLLDGQVHLIWSCRHQRPNTRRHMVENVLASWLLYGRWIADTHLRPTAIWFEHSLPVGTDQAQFDSFFESPVLFSQTYSALVIPQEYMQLPLRQADAQLLWALEEHAQGLMASFSDIPLPQQVKNVLRQLLKEGLPRKEQVAKQLAMPPRTLQRQLQKAGSGYQQILDDLRQELAEHYLLQSNMPIHDISQYLGFTDQRSFHRTFKKRTGMTPGELRQSKIPSAK